MINDRHLVYVQSPRSSAQMTCVWLTDLSAARPSFVQLPDLPIAWHVTSSLIV
jgi:hypothetical protein